MKSVSMRNLVGGFLGGTVGILLSGYIAPVALPFGVIAGVLIGWWNKEFLELLNAAYRDGKRFQNATLAALKESFRKAAVLGSLAAGASKTAFHNFASSCSFGKSVAAIKFKFIKFRRWLNGHPMNPVLIVRPVASVAFIIGLTVLAWVLGPAESDGALTVPALVAAIMGTTLYEFNPDFFGREAGTRHLQRFYRDWEIVDRYGLIGLTCHDLAMYFRNSIGFLLFFGISLFWLIASFLLTFVLISVLLIAALAVIPTFKMLHFLITRPGHQLCLGTTLVVTGLSWFLCHESFTDQRVLWFAALLTGAASGAATEILRGLAAPKMMKSRFGLGIMLDALLGDVVETGTEKVGLLWLGQSRSARLLRSACFGSPIVQPVKCV